MICLWSFRSFKVSYSPKPHNFSGRSYLFVRLYLIIMIWENKWHSKSKFSAQDHLHSTWFWTLFYSALSLTAVELYRPISQIQLKSLPSIRILLKKSKVEELFTINFFGVSCNYENYVTRRAIFPRSWTFSLKHFGDDHV